MKNEIDKKVLKEPGFMHVDGLLIWMLIEFIELDFDEINRFVVILTS